MKPGKYLTKEIEIDLPDTLNIILKSRLNLTNISLETYLQIMIYFLSDSLRGIERNLEGDLGETKYHK